LARFGARVSEFARQIYASDHVTPKWVVGARCLAMFETRRSGLLLIFVVGFVAAIAAAGSLATAMQPRENASRPAPGPAPEVIPPCPGCGGGGGGCTPSVVVVDIFDMQVNPEEAATTFTWDESPAGSSTTFYWGPSTSYGHTISVSGSGSYSVTLLNVADDIQPGAIYYYEVYAAPPASTCYTTYIGASYTGHWNAVWFSALVSDYGWVTQDATSGDGANVVSSGPSVTLSDGDASVDQGSAGGPVIGVAELGTEMQFVGQGAAFPSSTEVVVTETWHLIWVGLAAGTVCVLEGCGGATVTLDISGNVFLVAGDTTGWVLGTPASFQVAYLDDILGNPSPGSDNQYADVSFDACFGGGTYYQLYAYMTAQTSAWTVLGATADGSLSVSGAVSLSVQPTGSC
jgi:hypothetical protein